MITVKPSSLVKGQLEAQGPGVPIWVDSRKDTPEFAMTRCTYFTAECDWSLEVGGGFEGAQEPAPWILGLGEAGIPFAVQVLSGVVLGPAGDEGEFSLAAQIEETFDWIEKHPGLMVDIGELWLPNPMVDACHPEGRVFRVSMDLFRLSTLFKRGMVEKEEFLTWCGDNYSAISFSQREENAFVEWQEMQIAAVREQYPKSREYELSYKVSVSVD